MVKQGGGILQKSATSRNGPHRAFDDFDELFHPHVRLKLHRSFYHNTPPQRAVC